MITEDDCDDGDPESTTTENDGDCDGVRPGAPGVSTGAVYWRHGPGTGISETADLERAENVDSEVRGLMKSWGYVAK